MAPLDASGLLRLWERGQRLNALDRAVLLLGGAWPEYDPQGWTQLSIGLRDAWLVDLRVQLFGPRFELIADCPECGATLETSFAAGDLPRTPAQEAALTLDWQGYSVTYRLPTSADLLALAAADCADPSALLARCSIAVQRGGKAVPFAKLPAGLSTAIEQAMAEHDPGAEIDVELGCAACTTRFVRRFDILDHLSGQLDDWADRLLGEVHALARAYGWSERDILALEPSRRQRYLELIAA